MRWDTIDIQENTITEQEDCRNGSEFKSNCFSAKELGLLPRNLLVAHNPSYLYFQEFQYLLLNSASTRNTHSTQIYL